MDLFDVFGGRDNLVLMCDAKDFYENKEKEYIRFSLKDEYVWLFPCNAGYGLYFWNKDKKQDYCVTAPDAPGIRKKFETHTGYSLSF
jgi:hypothetical protein